MEPASNAEDSGSQLRFTSIIFRIEELVTDLRQEFSKAPSRAVYKNIGKSPPKRFHLRLSPEFALHFSNTQNRNAPASKI